MCGIAGIVKDRGVAISEVELRAMTDAIQHRGPDGSGIEIMGNVGLGHRRLAILDLSNAAAQPMVSQNGRYTITFNGEVYNYCEIASRLPDVKFRSSGDTEVLLEAFVKWGPDFVKELNGMFAIAIHDRQTNDLWLFRDRLGIKPLYYGTMDGVFAFASELKAFQKLEAFQTGMHLSIEAIGHFLHRAYIPSPWTIYQEVRSMLPGMRGVYRAGKFTSEIWWSLREQIRETPETDEKRALAQLDKLLHESVERCLISDVPLGTFLSGGIDSTLVTAIAQHHCEQPIQTFSIGFDESKFDESRHARQVAGHLGTDHHEFILSQSDALDQIESLVDIYDQPFGDSSAIPMMLVSQNARQHVKVALSGDGGDETHLGYGSYTWAERLNNPLVHLARLPISKCFDLLSLRFQRAAKVLQYPAIDRRKSHIFSQENYCFSEHEIVKLLKPNWRIDHQLDETYSELRRKLQPKEAQAMFDLEYYLPDDLLVKVDRASMLHALEVRVPLLDHELIEFNINISPNLRTKHGQSKYLLKELLYQYVPKSFFARPKWGFAIPLEIWLTKQLSYLLDRYLSPHAIDQTRVFNLDEVENLIHQFRSGKSYLYNRIWLLIVLQRWFMTRQPMGFDFARQECER